MFLTCKNEIKLTFNLSFSISFEDENKFWYNLVGITIVNTNWSSYAVEFEAYQHNKDFIGEYGNPYKNGEWYEKFLIFMK
jgi:hypothetical protein